MRNFLLLFILFSFVVLTACSTSVIETTEKTAQEVIEVSISDDSSRGDYVIKASYNGCSVEWFISEPERGTYLELRQMFCDGKSFSEDEERDVYRAMLSELFDRWPVDSFSSFSGYLFDGKRVELALASVNSPEYQDYRKNYPNSKVTSINAILVKLLEEIDAFKKTADLFNEFGATIQLLGVEKVGSSLVSDLSYKEQLVEMGISEDERVLTGAASVVFALISE